MSEASLFNTPVDRIHSDSFKWAKYRGQDIIPLWVADTDFRSPPAIVEALQKRVEHGVFGYGENPDQLNEIVIERLQRLYGWSIKPEHLVWLPGLVTGLHLACRSLDGQNKAVMTSGPVYPPLLTSPKISGQSLLHVAMKQDDNLRWVLDLDAMEERITPDCQLLLLCNPHNPGGTVYRKKELEQIAEFVIRHNLVICSDEIHCDLILDQGVRHHPIAALSDEIAQRCITLMAPSKTFNIAGLGCSFAVIESDEVRQRFLQARMGIVPHVNILGFHAALAAYQQGDEWLQEQLVYLKGNRDYLVEQINALPGLKLDYFEATYLAWIDVSKAQLKNAPKFFEQAGVGMSPGGDFGDDNFMRLNFGCTRVLLEEAVSRMSCALSG